MRARARTHLPFTRFRSLSPPPSVLPASAPRPSPRCSHSSASSPLSSTTAGANAACSALWIGHRAHLVHTASQICLHDRVRSLPQGAHYASHSHRVPCSAPRHSYQAPRARIQSLRDALLPLPRPLLLLPRLCSTVHDAHINETRRSTLRAVQHSPPSRFRCHSTRRDNSSRHPRHRRRALTKARVSTSPIHLPPCHWILTVTRDCRIH